ncbi:double zinc ribbon domain-containing protein [Halobacterium jilantaiense]|uniref:Ribbon-helix-helix protein, copG family n=1 Tax=Halobacterium jilantaiense TaxID=355548 RepID=A0A1I0P2H3_9EURY|nr:zinc ribbon domain-containing protein [Halobacterium jilantaiense]SEW08207.1 Ribbon-helix-helix protein, copG family [Halobacterium jilantaiense]
MSKVTFRADDDLVAAVEDLDASKSEVMREALRTYLTESRVDAGGSLDAMVADRVDGLVGDAAEPAGRSGGARDVNINITVETDDGASVDAESSGTGQRAADAGRGRQQPGGDGERSCKQCGSSLSGEHVYCPNCGEKASHRVFCECGDEVRADWAFCPHCGRRTASADALDRQG